MTRSPDNAGSRSGFATRSDALSKPRDEHLSPKAQDLANLLERVEKAEGADRELDARLFAALAARDPDRLAALIAERADQFPDRNVWLEGARDWQVKPYTASLDAALALVERKLPGWTWRLDSPDTPSEPAFARLSGPERRSGVGWAKTPALALLAALLRALIAQETEHVG